jgi:hypothetical protein
VQVAEGAAEVDHFRLEILEIKWATRHFRKLGVKNGYAIVRKGWGNAGSYW